MIGPTNGGPTSRPRAANWVWIVPIAVIGAIIVVGVSITIFVFASGGVATFGFVQQQTQSDGAAPAGERAEQLARNEPPVQGTTSTQPNVESTPQAPSPQPSMTTPPLVEYQGSASSAKSDTAGATFPTLQLNSNDFKQYPLGGGVELRVCYGEEGITDLATGRDVKREVLITGQFAQQFYIDMIAVGESKTFLILRSSHQNEIPQNFFVKCARIAAKQIEVTLSPSN